MIVCRYNADLKEIPAWGMLLIIDKCSLFLSRSN